MYIMKRKKRKENMKPINSQKFNKLVLCCMPMGMPNCYVSNISKNHFIM